MAHTPRQSKSVPKSLAQSDGDVWNERLAVCESVTDEGAPKLVVRSYFRNSRTDERIWDEPPSGAGQINHATDNMRKSANLEKDELQLTLNMIPADEEPRVDTPKEKKKKKGFLSRLRKKKEKPFLKDESKDLNLQKAIARSMELTKSFSQPVSNSRPEGTHPHDDDIELAKAISASEAEFAKQQKGGVEPNLEDELTEEELFQKALAATRAPKPAPDTAGRFDYNSNLSEEEMLKRALAESSNEQYAATGYTGETEPVDTRMVMAHSSGLYARADSYGETDNFASSQTKYQGKTDPNERSQQHTAATSQPFIGKTDPNERHLGSSAQPFLGKTDPNERYNGKSPPPQTATGKANARGRTNLKAPPDHPSTGSDNGIV